MRGGALKDVKALIRNCEFAVNPMVDQELANKVKDKDDDDDEDDDEDEDEENDEEEAKEKPKKERKRVISNYQSLVCGLVPMLNK